MLPWQKGLTDVVKVKGFGWGKYPGFFFDGPNLITGP